MKSKSIKIVSMLLAIFMITIIISGTSNANGFPDLNPTHWCYEKIMKFLDNGYVCGYEDGTFKADQTITRAEYVKIVNNFFGYSVNENVENDLFSDVSKDNWFYGHVMEAAERGYIEGYPDGTFRPGAPIRRQEAVVILSRILGIDKEEYPADHVDGMAQYSDSEEIEEWAYTAVHSYSVYNFINGYEDGTIQILQDVTRAETVELLNLLDEKIEIPEEDKKPSGGGGGGSRPKAKMPTIGLWKKAENNDTEEYIGAKKTISGWINFEETTVDNNDRVVLVNITTTTKGATIHETIDSNPERTYTTTTANVFDNMFGLTDGVYTVYATATKNGYKDSDKTESIIKVDTVSPVASGKVNAPTNGAEIAHDRSVEVNVIDPKAKKVNEISGLDATKLKYAWFKQTEDNYVKVTDWTTFVLANNVATIEAPTDFGTYKLGISAYDIAENNYGTLVDAIMTPNGEEKIEYDFVEEIADDDKDDDIIVVVGNNLPVIEDLVLYTKVGVQVSEDIIASDIDNDKLTYEVTKLPTQGTALVSETQTTYIPDVVGTFEYIITANDGLGGEDEAKVIVHVCDVDVTTEPDKNNPLEPGDTEADVLANGLTLYVGEEKDVEATLLPEFIKNESYKWSLLENETKIDIVKGENDDKVTIEGLLPGETILKVLVETVVDGKEIKIEKEIAVTVISKITLTADDKEKRAYNGETLTITRDDIVVKGQAKNDTNTVEFDFTDINVKDVCSGKYSANNVRVTNAEDGDVTRFYEITIEKGNYEITKKKVTITSASNTKVYDGEALVMNDVDEDIDVDGFVTGEGATYTFVNDAATIGIIDVGEIENEFTYELDDNTNAYNYDIEIKFGTLKVTPKKITLKSASDTKVYNGEALIRNNVETDITIEPIDGFVSGEGATYTFIGDAATVGITKVGELENKFTYELNANTKAQNYEITVKFGKLTVTDRDVEVSGILTMNDEINKTVEPGSTVTYTLKLENDGEYDEEIAISFNQAVTIKIGKEEFDLEAGEKLEDKIEIASGKNLKIEVTDDVPLTHPIAAEDFTLYADIDVILGNEKIGGTKSNEVSSEVEKTVTIAERESMDKNIVLILDTSGSMLFCTEHVHKEGTCYDLYRTKTIPTAFEDGAGGAQFLVNPAGDDGYYYTGYPCKGHEYFDGDSWKKCTAGDRTTVTHEALHKFMEELAKAAQINSEDISVTIVTYDDEAQAGDTFTFEKNKNNLSVVDDVCDEIADKMKITENKGTNISAGVDLAVTKLVNSAEADNYFILFGDGQPTQGSLELKDFSNKTENCYYAYAIGFGSSFADETSEAYKILETIIGTGKRREVIKASDGDDILEAFSNISQSITALQQSENGKIKVDLSNYESYYPIKFLGSSDGSVVIFELADSNASNEDVTIDGNTLIWDISGSDYSKPEYTSLRVQLTVEE